MKTNKSDWRHSVSISKLPKMLLFGVLLTMSSFSFAQTNAIARMTLDNNVTIRTGLNGTYEIYIAHFGFANSQEAVTYFQSMDVAYIDFVVVNENKVLMNFDLSDPAVANWTITDWKQALAVRALNSTPRPVPTNY